MTRNSSLFLFSLVLAIALFSSGCAAAILAGGVAGGYAVAKDMEDGKLIDN